MITLLPPPSPWSTMPKLIDFAATAYGLTAADVRSARRDRPIATARWAVMWAARHGTDLSFPQIGRKLGGRDHTTVMHGVARATELRDGDEKFRLVCDALLELLDDPAAPADEQVAA